MMVCVQRRSTHPTLRAPLRGGDFHTKPACEGGFSRDIRTF
jgi:hypothetical protein